MSAHHPRAARWASAAFFALLAVGLVLSALRDRPAHPRFAISTIEAPSGGTVLPAELREIPVPDNPRIVHGATLAAGADGRRVVVFYGGSGEMTNDSRLFVSRFDGRSWEPARVLFTPGDVTASERRWVRALGNPLLVPGPDRRLLLLFASASIGGWSAASLNLSRSTDGGASWSRPIRLPSSPLLDRSTLVRGAALPLDDGGFLVPAYHELGTKIPLLLRFDRGGSLVGRWRTSTRDGLFQPAAIAIDRGRALQLLRDRRGRPGRVHRQTTEDGGESWSDPEPTSLPNPDSALALARLDPGTLLLAWNSSPSDRSILSLSVSTDDGRSWEKRLDVENRPGGNFSYPFLLVDGDRIDLVYTFDRSRIRHLTLSRRSLDSAGGPIVGR